MADLEQWVNLEKVDKFKDEIETIERLDYLHFECEFKKAKLANFKVRIYPQGNKAKYSKEERKNVAFKLRKIPSKTNASNKKVKLETDAYLPAAGGNKFKVEAKYKKKVIESKKIIETRRKVYYQIIKMSSMNALSNYSFLDKLWNTSDKLYIETIEINSKGDDTHIGNIDAVDSQVDAMKAAARPEYNNDKHPFCFAILYVDSLAASDVKSRDTDTMSKGCSSKQVSFPKKLWEGVDSPTGSSNKDWFISAQFMGTTPPSNLPSSDGLMVNRTTLSVSSGNIPESKTGVVRVTAKIIDRWRGGLSFSGCNLVVCATRAFVPRQALDPALKEAIILHEVGHKLGMVPDGISGLDRQTNCDDTTYVGPHCADNSCVMFGKADSSRNDFCTICKKSVRKLNLKGTKLVGLKILF